MIYETTLEIDGSEYDIRCHYEYFSASKGAWQDGLQMEPDEAATAQINKIELNYAEPDEKADYRTIDLPWLIERDIEQEIVEENR